MPTTARTHLHNSLYLAILSALVTAGLFSLRSVEQTLAGLSSDGILLFAQILYAAATVLFVFLLTAMRSPVWISRSGRYSYTLYIIHYPILLSMGFVFHSLVVAPAQGLLWGAAVVAASLTILLAWMVSKWVERPAAQRKAVIGWLRNVRNRFETP